MTDVKLSKPVSLFTASGKEVLIGELFVGVSPTHSFVGDYDCTVKVAQLDGHPSLEGGREFRLERLLPEGGIEQVTVDSTWFAVQYTNADGTIETNVMPADTFDFLHRFNYEHAAKNPLGILALLPNQQVELAALRDEPNPLLRFAKMVGFFSKLETAKLRGDLALIRAEGRDAAETITADTLASIALTIRALREKYPDTGPTAPATHGAAARLVADIKAAQAAAATAPHA